jgi:hypothetical protein
MTTSVFDDADPGAIQKAAQQIVTVGMNGLGPFKSAATVANECLAASSGDVDDAVDRAIRLHVRYATTSGAVHGLGGLLVLPVTLTSGLAAVYVINARLAGTVAHLRGYDINSEEVRTIILVTLLGSGGSAALKETGIVIGTKTLHSAVMKVPGKVLIDINKKVGYRLLTKAGEKGVINMTKLVPLVGAPIGATADRLTTRSIAKYAMKNFPSLAHAAFDEDPM